MFLEIGATLNKAVLLNCLLKKGVSEKLVNILKSPYTNTSDRIMAWHLSPMLHSSSGVRGGWAISPFLSNHSIDKVLETALMELGSGSVNLLHGERLFDLQYADGIVLTCKHINMR